jgi:mannose-6-phosphate isomerase-like protein (cupin superfamily)
MKIGWQDAMRQLPGAPSERHPQGAPFAELLAHGTMSLEMYAPQGIDLQTPHTRDELYVVVAGQGRFVHGTDEQAFGPGDCFFVAAGIEHRFVDFTPDFKTWVVFYGPEGGEAQAMIASGPPRAFD